MKELSREEKAKRYDEAIKRAKEINKEQKAQPFDVMLKVFPELKESEGEKIRKELIEHIKDQIDSFISAPDCRDKYEEEELERYNKWIAWIEKQGEQKPADKVEPKIIDWSKHIKYEPNSPSVIKEKPAWSEEDEEELKIALDTLEKAGQHSSATWLKNVCLVPQSQWKPSEEQLKILNEVLSFAANHESPYWNDYIFGTLSYLIRQLKKLTK